MATPHAETRVALTLRRVNILTDVNGATKHNALYGPAFVHRHHSVIFDRTRDTQNAAYQQLLCGHTLTVTHASLDISNKFFRRISFRATAGSGFLRVAFRSFHGSNAAMTSIRIFYLRLDVISRPPPPPPATYYR